MKGAANWKKALETLEAYQIQTEKLSALFRDLEVQSQKVKKELPIDQTWLAPGAKPAKTKRQHSRRTDFAVVDAAQIEHATAQLVRFADAIKAVSTWVPKPALKPLAESWEAAFMAGYWAAAAKYSRRITAGPLGLALVQGGEKSSRTRNTLRANNATQFRRRYVELRAQRPKLLHVKATDIVAAEFGVSGKTVRAYVKNPARKNKLETKS